MRLETEIRTMDELEKLILSAMKIKGYKINDFGLISMIDELMYQQENGIDAIDQLEYIVNESIPEGLRKEYFEN